MIYINMSPETNTFPIYIKLIEQKGEKTERLIEEIKNLSIKFNILDDVSLSAILPSTSGSDENSLIYCINTTPTNHSTSSGQIIDFLEYIFQKMFDKYPAYTEPN